MISNQYNEYWETDEFEDLVASSLIGMYETKIKKTKKAPKCVRFDEDVFKRLKHFGCYFAPHDRVLSLNEQDNGVLSANQEIDIINDGIPDRAILTLRNDFENCRVDDAYLTSFYLERVPFLPKPFASDMKGKYFRITQVFFQNTHVSGDGTFIVIDPNGIVASCYIHDHFNDPLTGRPIIFKNRPVMMKKNPDAKDYYSAYASFAIQIYQDRRHLWNVQAYDGIAKATFGVYPEQIKSLFYARELPETTTGRKKPILHWVSAHQRRMKSGTEFGVDKYLRGTHEFIMNGTKFKITNPLKQVAK